jgi:hypothetical protein
MPSISTPRPTRHHRLKGELRAFIAAIAPLGWEHAGYDGRGHLRLYHAGTGARYMVPATPGDRRSYRNAIADLERLAGRKLPRPRSGKYRRTAKQPKLDFTQTAAELAAGAEIERLEIEVEALRAQFDALTGTETVDTVRRLIDRFNLVRDHLEQRYYRVIQPIDAVNY